MTSFIVPPALGKNKYVCSTKGRKRNASYRTDFPPGNFGLDIDRILAAVVPSGITPCRRVKRGRMRELHKANQRKREYGEYFGTNRFHARKDRKSFSEFFSEKLFLMWNV